MEAAAGLGRFASLPTSKPFSSFGCFFVSFALLRELLCFFHLPSLCSIVSRRGMKTADGLGVSTLDLILEISLSLLPTSTEQVELEGMSVVRASVTDQDGKQLGCASPSYLFLLLPRVFARESDLNLLRATGSNVNIHIGGPITTGDPSATIRVASPSETPVQTSTSAERSIAMIKRAQELRELQDAIKGANMEVDYWKGRAEVAEAKLEGLKGILLE